MRAIAPAHVQLADRLDRRHTSATTKTATAATADIVEIRVLPAEQQESD